MGATHRSGRERERDSLRARGERQSVGETKPERHRKRWALFQSQVLSGQKFKCLFFLKSRRKTGNLGHDQQEVECFSFYHLLHNCWANNKYLRWGENSLRILYQLILTNHNWVMNSAIGWVASHRSTARLTNRRPRADHRCRSGPNWSPVTRSEP